MQPGPKGILLAKTEDPVVIGYLTTAKAPAVYDLSQLIVIGEFSNLPPPQRIHF